MYLRNVRRLHILFGLGLTSLYKEANWQNIEPRDAEVWLVFTDFLAVEAGECCGVARAGVGGMRRALVGSGGHWRWRRRQVWRTNRRGGTRCSNPGGHAPPTCPPPPQQLHSYSGTPFPITRLTRFGFYCQYCLNTRISLLGLEKYPKQTY